MEISAGADEEENHQKERLELEDAEHCSLEGINSLVVVLGCTRNGGQFGAVFSVVQLEKVLSRIVPRMSSVGLIFTSLESVVWVFKVEWLWQ